jgi:hypothetical protein
LERDAKTVERAIAEVEDHIDDLDEGSSKIAGLQDEIAELNAEKEALLAQIPSDWDEIHDAFQTVTKVETKAYAMLKRLSSDSYAPVLETLDILASGDAFRALEAEVMATKDMVANASPADAVEPLGALSSKFSDVAGAGDVKSAISKARRAVKSTTPSKEKAQAELDKAIAAYQGQLEWRAKAEAEVAPKLAAYTESLRTTLGLKEQRKFTKEQALFVANCVSDHRDVSLSF